jgi:predicted dithiol-disulfide oxidoreductase (DUF899 family)
MTDPSHAIRFPGESDDYRRAREQLLRAESELRERLEAVAALRRTLPPGGPLKEDYRFEERTAAGTRSVRFSELFSAGKTSLLVYSFMYGPDADHPCPMCTSFLDGLDRYALHVEPRMDLVVVAKSPIERIHAFTDGRGWTRLRLLSSANNRYNADYHAETPAGAQLPACNVFVRSSDGIRHFWSAELLYAPAPGHARHIDLLWPIWSVFDLTPEGRANWLPKLAYD